MLKNLIHEFFSHIKSGTRPDLICTNQSLTWWICERDIHVPH